MTRHPDQLEWAATTFDVIARDAPDNVDATKLWRLVCHAVDVVRPDLERTRPQRDAASMLMEWLHPRFRRLREASP